MLCATDALTFPEPGNKRIKRNVGNTDCWSTFSAFGIVSINIADDVAVIYSGKVDAMVYCFMKAF